MLAIWGMVSSARTSRLGIYDFKFCISAVWMLYFVIAPTAMLYTGEFLPHHCTDPVDSLGLAIWYSVGAYLCLLWGMRSRFAHLLSEKLLGAYERFIASTASRKYLYVYLLVALAVLASQRLDWDLEMGRIASAAGKGYLMAVPVLAAVAASVLVVRATIYRAGLIRIAAAWALLLASCGMTFVVSLGGRGRAIAPVVITVIALGVSSGRNRVGRILCLAAMCIAVVLVAGAYRAAFMADEDRETAVVHLEDLPNRMAISAAHDYSVIDVFSCALEIFPENTNSFGERPSISYWPTQSLAHGGKTSRSAADHSSPMP